MHSPAYATPHIGSTLVQPQTYYVITCEKHATVANILAASTDGLQQTTFIKKLALVRPEGKHKL